MTEPVIIPDSVGKIVLPWFIPAQDVARVELHYQNRDGEEQTKLLEPASNGYISLPATEPVRQLYLKVDYYDSFG